MASLNKVQLIGYLGAEPEKKVTTSGTSVVSVNLATTYYYKDQMGQSQSNTSWHRLVFWKSLAELISSYTRKGSLIYVEGRLQTREWIKNDVKHYVTEIVVERMQFLDRKENKQSPQEYKEENNNYKAPSNNYSNVDPAKGVDNDFVEDDIPF